MSRFNPRESTYDLRPFVSSTVAFISSFMQNVGAIIIFLVAYLLVMAEEFTHLRKSKPVIIAAGIIWAMIGAVYMSHGMSEMAEHAVRQPG